ncbi:phosphohistidine phosphatase [Bacillus cereus]|nr:phosphohistidine phosphatase [Bacillus cereus]PFN78919.1 phosphohistidine phosphatase [Bacillus cereus]
MNEKIRIISGIALVITLILLFGLLFLGPKDSMLLLIFLVILGSVVLPLSVIGTAGPTSE